ncbi:MAG: hydroxyethylthiazole kinase [Anaerotardibacter sp.]
MGTVLTKKEIASQMKDASKAVRENNPMAGSITNNVTIDFVANAQLAVGGSAAMVYLEDEGQFLANAGNSVYINVGTLIPLHRQSILATAEEMNKLGKPWVLDPVAIGIGSIRTEILTKLKKFPPAIVRGNASEVIALAKLWDLVSGEEAESTVRGVDATDPTQAALPAAVALARFINGAVAVSGKEDIVTDGTTVVYLKGGSKLMASVTGFGCSLGGVCAVYATQTTPFIAALAATAHFNLAGTIAEGECNGPASFKVAFIDALYNIKPGELKKSIAKVKEAC